MSSILSSKKTLPKEEYKNDLVLLYKILLQQISSKTLECLYEITSVQGFMLIWIRKTQDFHICSRLQYSSEKLLYKYSLFKKVYSS